MKISFPVPASNLSKQQATTTVQTNNTEFDLTTADGKNQLLRSRLLKHLTGKSEEYIFAFCKNELTAISAIVAAQGNREQAQNNLLNTYRIINHENPAAADLVIDPKIDILQDLLDLFGNRSSIWQENVNRVAAKYTQALMAISSTLTKDLDLDEAIQTNIQSLLDQSSNSFRRFFNDKDSYIRNVKASQVTDNQQNKTLNIQLGQPGGSMGNNHLLSIKLAPLTRDLPTEVKKLNYPLEITLEGAGKVAQSKQKDTAATLSENSLGAGNNYLHLERFSFNSCSEFMEFLSNNKLMQAYGEIRTRLEKLGYPTSSITENPHNYFNININRDNTLAISLKISVRVRPLYLGQDKHGTNNEHQTFNDKFSLSQFIQKNAKYSAFDKLKKLIALQELDVKKFEKAPHRYLVFDSKNKEFRLKWNQDLRQNLSQVIPKAKESSISVQTRDEFEKLLIRCGLINNYKTFCDNKYPQETRRNLALQAPHKYFTIKKPSSGSGYLLLLKEESPKELTVETRPDKQVLTNKQISDKDYINQELIKKPPQDDDLHYLAPMKANKKQIKLLRKNMADFILTRSGTSNTQNEYNSFIINIIKQFLETLPGKDLDKSDFTQPVLTLALLNGVFSQYTKQDIINLTKNTQDLFKIAPELIKLLIEDSLDLAPQVNADWAKAYYNSLNLNDKDYEEKLLPLENEYQQLTQKQPDEIKENGNNFFHALLSLAQIEQSNPISKYPNLVKLVAPK